MKFIDSNILAYAFYDNEKREVCQAIIEEGGITDTICLAESFQVIQFLSNAEYATKSVMSLLKSNLKIIDTDVNVIFEALKRTAKYKRLSFIDLIHYSTALLSNCAEIASFDKDFEGLEIKRVE